MNDEGGLGDAISWAKHSKEYIKNKENYDNRPKEVQQNLKYFQEENKMDKSLSEYGCWKKERKEKTELNESNISKLALKQGGTFSNRFETFSNLPEKEGTNLSYNRQNKQFKEGEDYKEEALNFSRDMMVRRGAKNIVKSNLKSNDSPNMQMFASGGTSGPGVETAELPAGAGTNTGNINPYDIGSGKYAPTGKGSAMKQPVAKITKPTTPTVGFQKPTTMFDTKDNNTLTRNDDNYGADKVTKNIRATTGASTKLTSNYPTAVTGMPKNTLSKFGNQSFGQKIRGFFGFDNAIGSGIETASLFGKTSKQEVVAQEDEDDERPETDDNSSGIHIKESKEGTFTAAATKHKMGVQEFARHVLANKDKFSPIMVKKANFAKNAKEWNK